MPLDHERSNRGGKPLVSVGINSGNSERLNVFALALVVPRSSKRRASLSAPLRIVERFPVLGGGLTAWVSDWYRLKE